LRSFLPMAFTLSPFTISVNPNCEMRVEWLHSLDVALDMAHTHQQGTPADSAPAVACA